MSPSLSDRAIPAPHACVCVCVRACVRVRVCVVLFSNDDYLLEFQSYYDR